MAMDTTRNNAGDLLLARWEAHRLAARRDAVMTGRLVAGAGLDVIRGSEHATVARVITLEPQRIPLLNGDVLRTSA